MSGPRNAETRFDLTKLVSGSSKLIPMGARRCMTYFPRMMQRKIEWVPVKWRKKIQRPEHAGIPGIPGGSDWVGTSCSVHCCARTGAKGSESKRDTVTWHQDFKKSQKVRRGLCLRKEASIHRKWTETGSLTRDTTASIEWKAKPL